METFMQWIIQGFQGWWFQAFVGIAMLVVSFLLGRWRFNKQWRKKSFEGLLNVSLNSVIDGTLRIRTLLETSLDDVFINPVATSVVAEAAKQTKPGQALLPLPQDQAWHILNLVLNEVSERFAAGFMRRAAGLPVTSVKLLLALTNEQDPLVRTQKVRVMVVRKDELLDLPGTPLPRFEAPHHEVRWSTLMEMWRAYHEKPYLLIELELCF